MRRRSSAPDAARATPTVDENYDFLPADLAASSGIVHTDNISSWGHDPIATKVIRNHADGLVLDAGSGFKSTVYDHVVNLEVVGYPSTDVLGVGEHLPFADGSFDAALSLNVLEHVRDPFRCARELARVVRPGGKLYASVPFLQPYHGYPHHYYNMTASGLENLFAGAFTVEELSAPASAVPIWALSWFLNSYVAGLPADVGERFRKTERRGVDGAGRGLPRARLRHRVAAFDEHRACVRHDPGRDPPADVTDDGYVHSGAIAAAMTYPEIEAPRSLRWTRSLRTFRTPSGKVRYSVYWYPGAR